MAILLHDGVDRPPVALSRLAFGPETPYTTVLAATPPTGRHVLSPVVARVVRETLLGVVDHGTAVRLKGAFVTAAHDTLPVGGKTGSGDNRIEEFARGGRLIASLPVNRTAAFVFYIGDRWYGVISAMVDGPKCGAYAFTSSLPVAALRLYAPTILERVSQPVPAAAQLMAAHLVGAGQPAARDTPTVSATARDSSARQPAGRDSAAGRVTADTAAPAMPDSMSATRLAWRTGAAGHHHAPNHRARSPRADERLNPQAKEPPPTHPGL
jgi:membrane peptidoglycan carboxypeptidase